jgi:NAD(P)-dependent dehydrogenase (short-subunit alcohol dehydrogenase family)
VFKDDLLKGKRILVTGGGTGLGKEMTARYLQLGAETYICGRRKETLEQTAEELVSKHGGKVTPIPCDIRIPDAVNDMMDQIFAEGPLTGLVNNAAGNFISRTKDLSTRGFDAIANIVFHGTFYVTHAAGTRWIEGGHKGNIISILTTWVWNGSAYTVPSAMSKSAIKTMTDSLAVEWGPHGIRLNAILPGPFPTEGAWARLNPTTGQSERDYDSNPMGRVGEMEELTNLATFLMADGVDYLTGQSIAIDGGAYQATGGNFWSLHKWSDEDWQKAREAIQAANAKDKSKRGG